MLPPAPALFSTMKVWPKALPSSGARARARMSVVPPAAKGTTMRTGLVGQAPWARSQCGATTPAAPRQTSERRRSDMVDGSLRPDASARRQCRRAIGGEKKGLPEAASCASTKKEERDIKVGARSRRAPHARSSCSLAGSRARASSSGARREQVVFTGSRPARGRN